MTDLDLLLRKRDWLVGILAEYQSMARLASEAETREARQRQATRTQFEIFAVEDEIHRVQKAHGLAR